jgi:hypothetical protein
MAKQKTVPAENADVDDFLNDNPPVIEEDLSPEEVEKLDLTQVPPPSPVVDTNTRNSTVATPKTMGTTKTINFSRFGAGKRPITTDLSDQMLPPITRKRSAIYQLIGAEGGFTEDKRIDASDSQAARVVDVSDFEMHPSYTIYDEFEPDFGRKSKVVTYYDGVARASYKDPVTGEMRSEIRQKVGLPRFVRGQHVCDIMKNYHQFLWFELHPGNKTNKFRDKSKSPLFERIDLKHYNPHVGQFRTELKLDAMNYVRSLSPDKAMDLAAALDIPTFRVQPSDIKSALYVKAEADPEAVMFKSPNKAISVTVTVMRAMDLGIIDYDASKKQYFFAQNTSIPIFQVPLDEPPVQALARYLVEDGEDLREKIDEYSMYWL